MINYIKNLSTTTKAIFLSIASAAAGAGILKLVQHYTEDEEVVKLRKERKQAKKDAKKKDK